MASSMRSRAWVPRDQDQWVLEIREILAEANADDTAASIFNVPEGVREKRPLAYTPQVMALGPYHHWKPQLYEMEQYKLSAAARIQERLPCRRIEDVAERFHDLTREIRAHYIRYLDFNNETLSWLMVVDVCFLLEFLNMYNTTNQAPRRLPSMFHLYGNPGKKSSNGDVVRDVMMLENQLPLFLLTEILNLMAPPSISDTDSVASDPNTFLETMLTNFLKGLTLFRSVAVSPRVDITTTPRAHLLDVLYHTLVPIYPASSASMKEAPYVEYMGGTTSSKETPPYSTYIKKPWESMYNTFNAAPIRFVKGMVTSGPVLVVVRLPWKLLRSLVPWWSNAEEGIKNKVLGDEEGKPPLVEEILIPSVEELVEAGVRFRSTDGGFSTIAFNLNTATFSLPSVTLDGTTEVVLRNLVAYESSAICGPLVLARYTELMNGIIDTEEDVRLLRKSGIVNNRMKSDAEVAEMWNGMSKSVRLTKVGFIDKVVADVNAYYNGSWKVRAKKALKRYVYGSWRLLALVAAVLLLLLNGLQAFCSVYSCGSWINIPSTSVN